MCQYPKLQLGSDLVLDPFFGPEILEGGRAIGGWQAAPIEEGLEALPEGQQVMLKLSIPKEAGIFGGLTKHDKVLRVVALSGGYSTEEACSELAKNPGMIASFSRGLLQDLRKQQSDSEFDGTLSGAIDQIHAASVA